MFHLKSFRYEDGQKKWTQGRLFYPFIEKKVILCSSYRIFLEIFIPTIRLEYG